jgi:hypothetical protein
MQSIVVQAVDRKNFGETQTTTGALNSSVAKNANMNGLSESPTHASSQYLESAPQRCSNKVRTECQDAGGSPDLQRKLGARDSTQSLILVIYQLLLKNNTKYCGVFERNKGGVDYLLEHPLRKEATRNGRMLLSSMLENKMRKTVLGWRV